MTFSPFGRTITDALRRSLGDWRTVTAIPEHLGTDPAARFDFYTDLGFNDDLTNLPINAFTEILTSSGFKSDDLPEPVERYGRDSVGTVDENSSDDVPNENIDAYLLIFTMETNLRRFIDEQMTQQHGDQWVKQRTPPNMYQRWQEKRRTATKSGEAELELIAYADFTDYADIICRKDNWKDTFEQSFKRRSNIQESLRRLHPLRLSTMHSRVIIQQDLLLAHAEVKRILKAIHIARV